MKNFLVLCVTAALGYLGYDVFQPPPPPPRPVAHVAALPAPVAAPKVYFHSALDAPAMRTDMTSGSSYFSTDPNSRFVPSYGYGFNGGYGYWGGNTTVIVNPGSSRALAPASQSGIAGVVSQARQAQNLSYLRDNVVRATPNPYGTAR